MMSLPFVSPEQSNNTVRSFFSSAAPSYDTSARPDMAAFALLLPLNVDVSDFSRMVDFWWQEALIPFMIPIHG
jgi:hypothetical protein